MKHPGDPKRHRVCLLSRERSLATSQVPPAHALLLESRFEGNGSLLLGGKPFFAVISVIGDFCQSVMASPDYAASH